MRIQVQSFDVKREASVYFNNEGTMSWTKAWFNGRHKSEPGVEITREMAIAFIKKQISLDDWLTRLFPKQMSAYHKSMNETRQQLIGY